jgi:magnesium chelatase subunit D
MGANQRMTAAKGAVLSLLLDAYQKRDRVALIAFKGQTAELILPPTDSVELAKKRLEILPTGGKTPLSQGLMCAFELIEKEERKKDHNRILLVLISDGRGNVSMSNNKNAFDESLTICEEITNRKVQSLVIDIETGFVRMGKMKLLADKLKAKYYSTDNLQSDLITNVVKSQLK